VPALRALATAFPDRPLLLAAPAPLAPLVRLIGAGPHPPRAGVVDQLLPLPAWVGGRPPDVRAAASLPRGALAVNLHGDGPQSHRLLLATAPERLLAFAHPDVPESAGGPPPQPPAPSRPPGGAARSAPPPAPEHERERWCRLLTSSGIAADPSAFELGSPVDRTPLRGATDRASDARPTVVHPGAASAARRWPAERWAAVARAERAAGRAVLVTGSGGERALAAEVVRRAGLPPGANRAGTTDLLGLAQTVAGAGRVVCGDSGVAHLATAFGTPSVVLFGPVSPARWGPPPDRADLHRVLWHPPDAHRDPQAASGVPHPAPGAPPTAAGDPHPPPGAPHAPAPGDPHADRPDPALLAIAVEEVVAALDALPARPAPPRRPRPRLTASTAP
jgi:hypothetical protein